MLLAVVVYSITILVIMMSSFFEFDTIYIKNLQKLIFVISIFHGITGPLVWLSGIWIVAT